MPESVFTASKPTLLTTGGKIWMCSTPFGKTGYFLFQLGDFRSQNEPTMLQYIKYRLVQFILQICVLTR